MSNTDQVIADSLNRIEQKLDGLAEKVNKHDGAVSALMAVGAAIAGGVTILLGWVGLSKH